MNEPYDLCDDCHVRIKKNIDKSFVLYKPDSPEEMTWCEECYNLWIKKAVECGWRCDNYTKKTNTN